MPFEYHHCKYGPDKQPSGGICRGSHAFSFCVRQGYEELEKQLKDVFKERSTILHQLTKTSRELDGIKDNLQSLKNDEKSAKTDVQMLLEIGQKQREQMKSLQEMLQNQLKETSEKAEKQEATVSAFLFYINFLKTEVERKSKMIRDLQNEIAPLYGEMLSIIIETCVPRRFITTGSTFWEMEDETYIGRKEIS
ncbi:hypothetical protein HPG69_005968 [Diceros bicornis minor]|uniref:Uncharacterized protein n=1 Tax=Diceros bicornis minor TaxID=77932 RepID=A0A7J7ET82_DICBM|nr:hypothetical protein HPG69_005968 [Diceros bicornis minor]